MDNNLERLRKQAKKLRKLLAAGDHDAQLRVEAVLPGAALPNHAAALHVIARERGYDSWPKLKLSHEFGLMDRHQRAERLKIALFYGQHWVAERLLSEEPDLGSDNFGLQCALYDIDAVRRKLQEDPAVGRSRVGIRTPILHLSFSKHFQTAGASREAMIAVAEALLAAGADVNDGYAAEPGSDHKLSALYGALGHAGNLELAEWLLEHGASPDDNESLYHATELDSLEGLRLLMRYGVRTEGTNALARMLDFDNFEGVKLLLDYGADPNEGITPHPSGQPATVIPALHQAARRNCSVGILQLLVDRGAEGRVPYKGHSAYALARMLGNRSAAGILERNNQATELDAVEDLLARAADGPVMGSINADAVSDEQRRIIGRLLGFSGPAPLDHLKRLAGLGIDPNWTDEMGLPAIHIAGWQGHAYAVEWLLGQNPDLTCRNNFGGDLLGTIIHGAEFSPHRAERDHLRCANLTLQAGAPLSRREIEMTGVEDLRLALEEWAETNPGQVVD